MYCESADIDYLSFVRADNPSLLAVVFDTTTSLSPLVTGTESKAAIIAESNVANQADCTVLPTQISI